jgi:hypothetical protein
MVYELANDLDDFACFVIPDEEQCEVIRKSLMSMEPLTESWQAPAVTFDARKRKSLGDFPGFASFRAPVLSRRAWEAVEPLIGNKSTALPLGRFQDVDYFVINVLDMVDALDVEKSTFNRTEYFENGTWHWKQGAILRNAVFRSGAPEGHHLFQIPQRRYAPFLASEEFAAVIAARGLKGALLRPLR